MLIQFRKIEAKKRNEGEFLITKFIYKYLQKSCYGRKFQWYASRYSNGMAYFIHTLIS